jgi:hypothetical protein
MDAFDVAAALSKVARRAEKGQTTPADVEALRVLLSEVARVSASEMGPGGGRSEKRSGSASCGGGGDAAAHGGARGVVVVTARTVVDVSVVVALVVVVVDDVEVRGGATGLPRLFVPARGVLLVSKTSEVPGRARLVSELSRPLSSVFVPGDAAKAG